MFYIFYRETRITIFDTSMLYSFLKNIGYARRQNVAVGQQVFDRFEVCQKDRTLCHIITIAQKANHGKL